MTNTRILGLSVFSLLSFVTGCVESEQPTSDPSTEPPGDVSAVDVKREQPIGDPSRVTPPHVIAFDAKRTFEFQHTDAKLGATAAAFVCPPGQLCACTTMWCGNPPSISLVDNGNGTLTYSSSGVTQCGMSYYVPATGQSDSFPVPENTTATPGAGSQVYYSFTCIVAAYGTVFWSDTKSIFMP
jgi:hypothetical protein